jgi:hypothetical protein
MAAVCIAAAVAIGTTRGASTNEAFTPASLAAPPSTIPPRTRPASTSTPASVAVPPASSPTTPQRAARSIPPVADAPSPVPSTTTTLPLSPLNSLLGEAVSAQPVAPLPDVAPTAIAIEAIGLGGVPVRPVGIAPDGQLEVPDETEVGWYRLGAAPGQPGATVLAAHVSWRDRAGPFLRLGELQPGAFVDVTLEDGASRRYQVVERAQYGKLMLPRDEIWRTSGPESLVLITCGGAFNPELRRYADNIVVTAVPVAGSA